MYLEQLKHANLSTVNIFNSKYRSNCSDENLAYEFTLGISVKYMLHFEVLAQKKKKRAVCKIFKGSYLKVF